MELQKLKPCPYCGSERIARYVGASHKTMVYCIPCSETYDHAVTMPENAWNKRPIENELRERIKILEIENDRLNGIDDKDDEDDDFMVDEDKPDKRLVGWNNDNNG